MRDESNVKRQTSCVAGRASRVTHDSLRMTRYALLVTHYALRITHPALESGVYDHDAPAGACLSAGGSSLRPSLRSGDSPARAYHVAITIERMGRPAPRTKDGSERGSGATNDAIIANGRKIEPKNLMQALL